MRYWEFVLGDLFEDRRKEGVLMHRFRSWRLSCLCGLAVACVVPVSRARAAAEDDFYRAYYEQTKGGDLAQAAELYSRVVADKSAPEAIRKQAERRLAQCREDLMARDLAAVMPRDVLAYVEVRQPGAHVGRVLEMLGLTPEPGESMTADVGGVAIGDGIRIPDRVKISPALIRTLASFRGLAVGVRRFDPKGPPDALVALHPGDSDLLRGLLDTARQFLEPAAPVSGFATYHVGGKVWVTVTNRLILASPSRELIAEGAARLGGKGGESLADVTAFADLAERRKDSAVFAYVSGSGLVEQIAPALRGKEGAIAQRLIDLEHLDHLTVSLGATSDGFAVRAAVTFQDGHQSLAYGLLRTAPLSLRSLDHVPAGVASLTLVGLNPATEDRPTSVDEKDRQVLAAMDFGREVFSNIEEFAVFQWIDPDASEATRRSPLQPDVAFVFSVKDPSKSEMLWTQMLMIASLADTPIKAEPGPVEIEGVQANVYHVANVVQIAVAKSPERALIVGTRDAVAASLRAIKTGKNVTTDQEFKPLLDGLTPHTSKAVLVHVGRALKEASRQVSAQGGGELAIGANLGRQTRLSIAVDEAPNELRFQLQIAGFPDIREIMPILQRIALGGRASANDSVARRIRPTQAAPTEAP